MDWLHTFVLAAIQGLTEFLPISSSGHLVLPAVLLGWPDQGLAFDVAVHVGSLAAVLWYFRTDVADLLRAWLASLGGHQSAAGRLAWLIIVATLPAAVAGLFLNRYIEAGFRGLEVLAATTIIFGIFLGIAGWTGQRTLDLARMTLAAALLIGIAQALALIPGTSRSGITLTAALLLGFQLQAAARFSFLLSIPIILAAGTLKTVDLATAQLPVPWLNLGVAAVVSGVTAYFCIGWFLGVLERIGLWPFVVYRLLLGMLLVAVALA